MRQEVVLAMLAKEPSHGYQLRDALDSRRPTASPVATALPATR
jgi:DNA-binding PadR family transcriptional regulator